MPFAYYQRLSRKNQAIYRRSDRLHTLEVPSPARLAPAVAAIRGGLEAGDRRRVAAAAQQLCVDLARALKVPPIEVRVLEVRPTSKGEELYGIYSETDEGKARIRVWMRTARHGRVVAFKTFLRTLLHEVCHHVDYTKLDIYPSFHTEGFFKRESSLFKQVVGEAATTGSPGKKTPGGRATAARGGAKKQ